LESPAIEGEILLTAVFSDDWRAIRHPLDDVAFRLVVAGGGCKYTGVCCGDAAGDIFTATRSL
jgi:hypothetical protein